MCYPFHEDSTKHFQTGCSLPSTHSSSSGDGIPTRLWGIPHPLETTIPPLTPLQGLTESGWGHPTQCLPRKCFYMLRLAKDHRTVTGTLFPNWKECHPSWPTPYNRGIMKLCHLRKIASDSTKDRHRNLKNTSDVLTTAQGPGIVTSVYTSIYRKMFNWRQKEMAQVKYCFSMNFLIPSCWEYPLSLKAPATF